MNKVLEAFPQKKAMQIYKQGIYCEDLEGDENVSLAI